MNKIRMSLSGQLPIVVIIGSTGCGKSKLAIELAKIFGGEVISADSMQVYKGLDIITNKVKEEEGIPHHLLDFVNPLKRFTVTDFSKLALPLINNIIDNKKLPIIVGGTNYYIESLLWKVLVSKESMDNSNQEENFNLNHLINKETSEYYSTINDKCLVSSYNNLPNDKSSTFQRIKDIMQLPITFENVTNISNQELHEILKVIDFKMANKLHPNDRRKIIRSLQIYQQHGITHSQILEEQSTQIGGSSLGGPLRFKNSCILYLQCDQNVLNERLDSRVDDMINAGLIKELQNFYEDYKKSSISNNIVPDYTYGIFQSIGFKEFHDFIMLPEDEKETEEGKKLFEEGLSLMKLVTKRYSKKQRKWIVNRFLKQNRDVPPVYGLQTTNLSQWQEKVLDPAILIVNAFINEHKPCIEPLPTIQKQENIRQLYVCNECKKTIIGTEVWEKHLKSRKHLKMKGRIAKKFAK